MSPETASNQPSSIIDSDLYQNPKSFLDQSIANLDLPEPIQQKWDAYLQESPSAPGHQQKMQTILDELLEASMDEEAGLISNVHRTLTKFRGYDPNYKVSENVDDCFNDEMDIPDRGVILVDYFVTRNLPAVVAYCKDKKIDLGRIRARVPQSAFAAQVMGLSGGKKAEFEAACAELSEDQFLIEDENHVQDIQFKEKVAVMLSPRTAAIYPKLHAETEDETINNYRGWIRSRINQLVPGGRMLLNIAKVNEFEPLGTEINEKGLAKLTSSVSDKVAKAVLKETNRKGATILQNGTFSLPDYDHSKEILRYHAQKPRSLVDRIKNRLGYWWKRWQS